MFYTPMFLNLVFNLNAHPILSLLILRVCGLTLSMFLKFFDFLLIFKELTELGIHSTIVYS